jgi:hypothetical protein
MGGKQQPARLLWNYDVHYHVHNSLSLSPVCSELNSVLTLLRAHFNTFLQSTPVSFRWFHHISLFHENCIFVSHECYMSHQHTLVNLVFLFTSGEAVQIIKLIIMQFFPFSFPLLYFRQTRCPQRLLCVTLNTMFFRYDYS